MKTPDSTPPSDRDGKADADDAIEDEPSKDEQRFNDQLMDALSDHPPPSEDSAADDDGDDGDDDEDAPAPKSKPRDTADGDEESEEETLSSPGTAEQQPVILDSLRGDIELYDSLDDDAPDSISLETISAAALESYDEYGDDADDESDDQWAEDSLDGMDPTPSEPPSLRSLALHLPKPDPVPKLAPSVDDEIFGADGPDPYNALSESLRPPPVMKSAPQLIRDDEDDDDPPEPKEKDDDDEAVVPLRRRRPASSDKNRKARGQWVQKRSQGRRKRDHRPLVWPCIAFFCLGVVATRIGQRLSASAGSQPVAAGPDRPGEHAGQGPDEHGPTSPGEQPPAHEAIPSAEPTGTEPGETTPATGTDGSPWPLPDPAADGEPTSDGPSDSSAAPTASAPEPPASADEGAPADTPPGEAPPFNTAAAAASLGAAAANAASCANGEHKGSARVAVTFAPSGRSTVAIVESGSLLGTPVASCIAGMMRNTQVPAFSGGPVTVRKKVRIR